MTFLIDPQHVREALLGGCMLRVQLSGDRLQYRKVTLEAYAAPTRQPIAIKKRANA